MFCHVVTHFSGFTFGCWACSGGGFRCCVCAASPTRHFLLLFVRSCSFGRLFVVVRSPVAVVHGSLVRSFVCKLTRSLASSFVSVLSRWLNHRRANQLAKGRLVLVSASPSLIVKGVCPAWMDGFASQPTTSLFVGVFVVLSTTRSQLHVLFRTTRPAHFDGCSQYYFLVRCLSVCSFRLFLCVCCLLYTSPSPRDRG